MAKNSKIEWTDHTFNPWMGCTRVSAGCQHCYAETLMDARYHKVQWGPHGTRVRTSAAYWKQPLQWNKQFWTQCDICGWRGVYDAQALCPGCEHPMIGVMTKTRQRVFCASLADVFEDRDELTPWRAELFELIEATPNLDWLLLTKRPECVTNMIPYTWLKNFPQNIWMGTSAETQKTADLRLPYLINIPAKVRFVSCEPLLTPVRLQHEYDGEYVRNWLHPTKGINWVICGGESGPEARPMHPEWAQSLRDQCLVSGVPFFFKQWGEYGLDADIILQKPNTPYVFTSDMKVPMWKAGKKYNGRELDGFEWKDFPR